MKPHFFTFGSKIHFVTKVTVVTDKNQYFCFRNNERFRSKESE